MVVLVFVLSFAFIMCTLNTISLIKKEEESAFRGMILSSLLFASLTIVFFFYT